MEEINAILDGNNLNFHVPIQKVDVENRLVSGFATLDNVDKHDDIILADASERAFAQFRGNIREMHDSAKAVGKMVKFESRPYFDPISQKTFNGVYVTAKITRGAEDTWQKVIDGVLDGFSIGAIVKDKGESMVDGRMVRVIKDYELFELSLVDSPANPLANVFSIQKMDDGSVSVTGLATQADDDESVELNNNEDLKELVSTVSGDAGFVEKVLNFIDKMISQGGNSMNDVKTDEEVTKSVDTDAPVEETVEVDAETVDEIESVEKAASISEVTDEIAADAPAFDADSLVATVVEKVLESLSAESNDSAEVVAPEESATTESDNPNDETLKSLVASLSEVSESVAKGLADLSARLESLEKNTAVRKSADVEEDEGTDEVVSKSFWGGTVVGPGFLNTEDIKN